jgi:hypothetical protein
MIIGTHNSGAYKLDLNKSFWSKTEKYEIIRIMSSIEYIKTLIFKTTITQKLNISQQLKLGCRAFDIRVSIINNTFYVNHTYCCTTLNEILLQITEFLSNNAAKIILFIRADWETRHTVRGREFEVLNYIDDRICAQIERGKIECFCDFPRSIIKHFNMNHYNEANMVWFNVDTVEKFENELARAAARKDFSPATLNFVLTMKENASLKTILNTDLEKMAGELNAAAPILIRKYFPSNCPKVILFDFVNEELIKDIQKMMKPK